MELFFIGPFDQRLCLKLLSRTINEYLYCFSNICGLLFSAIDAFNKSNGCLCGHFGIRTGYKNGRCSIKKRSLLVCEIVSNEFNTTMACVTYSAAIRCWRWNLFAELNAADIFSATMRLF